jgi:hypothetical protein
MKRMLLLSIVLLVVPSAASATARVAASIAITPYVTWTSGNASCPNGAADLETKQVPIPAAGESVTVEWVGEYPSCSSSAGFGFNRQASAPRLPFTTSASYRTTGINGENRPCTVVTRGTCSYKFILTLTSRAAEPPPTCTCAGVQTAITRTRLNFLDQSRFHFQLRWTLACEGKAGGCRAQIDVEPPPGFAVSTQKTLTISCAGRCARKPATQTVFIGGTSPDGLLKQSARRNKTYVFRFRKFCIAEGKRVPAGVGRLTVVYDAKGITDQKRSDFDGDGKADGR